MQNQSAVKKNSYLASFGGFPASQASAISQLMIPASHKRRSGYKVSLLSGGGNLGPI
jgi:hypothetical protein